MKGRPFRQDNRRDRKAEAIADEVGSVAVDVRRPRRPSVEDDESGLAGALHKFGGGQALDFATLSGGDVMMRHPPIG